MKGQLYKMNKITEQIEKEAFQTQFDAIDLNRYIVGYIKISDSSIDELQKILNFIHANNIIPTNIRAKVEIIRKHDTILRIFKEHIMRKISKKIWWH